MKTIQITISNKIKVFGLTDDLMRSICKGARVPNPLYHRLQAMKKTRALYACPKYFQYYCLIGDSIVELPRGLKQRLLAFLDKNGIGYQIEYKTISQSITMPLSSQLTPRGYQEEALEKILENTDQPKEGIIFMSTGSGKSLVALEAACRLKLKTTIIVPRTVILNQFVAECQRYYAYTPGVICAKKKEIKDITIATAQSLLSDRAILKDLSEQTSVLIIDECQEGVSAKRQKLFESFSPKHLFGLTATPFRSKDDGRTDAIPMLFGQNIVEYEKAQMQPIIIPIEFSGKYEGINYQEVLEELSYNKGRNLKIASLVIEQIEKGKKTLVLTKRIDHYKNIAKDFEHPDGCYFIDSNDKDRDSILIAMKEGKREYKAVYGTFSLLAAGFDIPDLDTLIMACPIKGNVQTIQSAGRILRLFPNKKPTIYYIYDRYNRFLKRHFNESMRTYKEQGWEVIGV